MIEGRIAGSVLVAHDITERKRTEAALRESEARYRTAGEAIRYGVWVCNPEGVEFVSQTFLDLIGKTLDEVKPRGWLDRLPPEDLKPTLDAWRGACAPVPSGHGSTASKARTASIAPSSAWAGRCVMTAIASPRGSASTSIYPSASRRRTRCAKARRFRGTFENAAVGISNIGIDGAWLRVNQRLCDILGYSRSFCKRTFNR